eukprot:14738836-Alexandrium_andersonii.AAC.1
MVPRVCPRQHAHRERDRRLLNRQVAVTIHGPRRPCIPRDGWATPLFQTHAAYLICATPFAPELDK